MSKSSGGMEGSFSSLARGGRGFEGRSGRAMGSRGTVAGKERGCARAGRTRADESRKSEESASGRERARVSTLIRARWQPAGRRQARRPPAYLSLVAPTWRSTFLRPSQSRVQTRSNGLPPDASPPAQPPPSSRHPPPEPCSCRAMSLAKSWFDHTFSSRQATEQLLRPDLESGLLSQHDFNLAVDFLPGYHRYLPVCLPC